MLDDTTIEIFPDAAKAAARMDLRDEAPKLYRALRALTDEKAEAAVVALIRLGGEDVRQEMLDMLPNTRGNVHFRIVRVLHALGDESVLDWMRDYAKDYLEPSVPNQALLAFTDYLDNVIAVSGQPFMYSWNTEKAAGIRDILGRWTKGKRKTEADRDYVFRNLFVFGAPKAWRGRPPFIPEVVQRAMA